ncbi:BatA domain-containing protein [Haloferax sp. DFSO60]|uniref:DUF7408 domain-containing protein n=1 Tax=Haloferax sp. DFSO60 TaxID=3388652 RepID=UPI0039792BE9
MVLDEYVLSPLGLLALLGIVPLVLLYLLRPDPIRRTLPTFQFLATAREQNVSNPKFERLVRSLLLVLQLLAIVALAGTLATPYVLVPESETVSETVLVVDSSASMSVSDGGATRFERARSAARNEISGTTTIVAAGGTDDVLLRRGTPADARNTLDELSPTAAPGDLRTAISTAMAVAGEDARIVVLSDFADDSPWQDAVREARARGLVVELRQFAGGGSGNVGIIDRRFSGTNVTVSIKNYGTSATTRTVSLGGTTQEVELGAGDVTTATLPVPAGGGELTLSPGDSFALDDRLYVAAPEDASVDVLVLTNDENEYLTAALSVIPQVTLTVDNPPTTVSGTYDVIIYSNIDDERFLRGNREAGQDLLADGGGVAIQAQEEMPNYDNLLLVSPQEMGSNPSLGSVTGHELTREITFPPPNEYVVSNLTDGRALVTATDGSPLLAIAERDAGRLVYYGFLEDGSAFKYNYQYPVFWKRTVFYLAGRSTLTDLNQATGETLRINENQTIETPRGTATGPEVRLDAAGFYQVGDERFAASLLSEPESDIVAEPIEQQEASDSAPVTVEERLVPDPLTEWAALGALGLVIVELGYLRRRGDL